MAMIDGHRWPAVVETAHDPDSTVDYVFSRSSLDINTSLIRGLGPAAPAEGRFHLDVPEDGHVAARKSRAKRSAGGGFLLPYRIPAPGLQRRSAAEAISDTGAVASSLRPARPSSAVVRTIALNRPRAAETGARIGGQESYWEPSRRRPRSAQTAQQRAAADAALKGCRPGVALTPTARSLGRVVQPGLNQLLPRAARPRVRRRPLSASASASSLRAQQAQAQAQPHRPWQKVMYEPTNDPVGLLARPVNETVSSYDNGYDEAALRPARLTWGRLLRGWWTLCDVGPLLRAEGLAPPPPRTPPIELCRRTIQQLDEQSDIGAGRRFALALAERRLILAQAMFQSVGSAGVPLEIVSRVATQLPMAMLALVHRECAGGEIPSCAAVTSKARAVSLLSNADRAQMIRAGERARPGKSTGPSARVAAISSCLVVLMAIEKYGVGAGADDALASNDDWSHVRKIFDAEGLGKIGDGWQAASRLIMRLATTNSRRLMRVESTSPARNLAARSSDGQKPTRVRRVWLQRSVVACLAPMLTSSEFLAKDDPSATVFGGWPTVARWLAAWFAYAVHPDDLDILFEWRQHYQNAALSGAVAAALGSEQPAVLESPTPGWAATYLNPAASSSNKPAAKIWMLDTSGTLALMAFLEPVEMFSLAQSTAVLWRWLRDPAVLVPVWAVAARAHAAAARALARCHRRMPRVDRQLQQERACVRLEGLCAAASVHPITLTSLLAHCSPGGNGLHSTPSAYTRHRSLSPRLEFAVEAYYMMWQADPVPAAARHGTSDGRLAAPSPSLWYKPASRYGSQLCSNWEAAAAHLLSHATATGPLSALRNGRDNSMSLSVTGVLSLLEKLPETVERASLPDRLLPWVSVLMQPAWRAAADAPEAERLAVAIGQVVVAADCAARIATGAVTEEADIVEQLGVCRMRRFTELALSESL